jgi:hypothetical protein
MCKVSFHSQLFEARHFWCNHILVTLSLSNSNGQDLNRDLSFWDFAIKGRVLIGKGCEQIALFRIFVFGICGNTWATDTNELRKF